MLGGGICDSWIGLLLVYECFVIQNIFFREAPDVLLQKTVVEDNRYDGLDKVDRGKVGLHVSILQKICTPYL